MTTHLHHEPQFPLRLVDGRTYSLEKFGHRILIEVRETRASALTSLAGPFDTVVDDWDHLFCHWNIDITGDVDDMKCALRILGKLEKI